MTLEKPSEYFVFCPPQGSFVMKDAIFFSETPNPYNGFNLAFCENKDTEPYVEKVNPYELRYFLEINLNREPSGFPYRFKKMTELEVIQSFFERAFEYLEDNELEVFLEY